MPQIDTDTTLTHTDPRAHTHTPVSYTHLDVYKRQVYRTGILIQFCRVRCNLLTYEYDNDIDIKINTFQMICGITHRTRGNKTRQYSKINSIK